MKENLKVEPLYNDYKIRYPAFSDPNPLDHPESIPYPFRSRFIHAVTLAGMSGAFLFNPTGAVAQNHKHYNTDGPSLLQHAPLPYTPSSFGTGQPSRISYDEAREYIIKAFDAESIPLKLDEQYENNRLDQLITGYNDSLKIGFMLIDYNHMGDGMTHKRRGMYPIARKLHSKVSIEHEIQTAYESYLEDHDKFIKYTSYTLNSFPAIDSEFRFLNNRDLDYSRFRKVYIQMLEKTWYSKMTQFEAYQKVVDFIYSNYESETSSIALVRNLDFDHKWLSDPVIVNELNHYLTDLAITKDHIDLKGKIESLARVSNLCSFHRLSSNLEMQRDIICRSIKAQYHQRKKYYRELKNFYDLHKLDLNELGRLEENISNEKDYIAPIFMRDGRMTYSNYGFFPSLSTGIKKELQERKLALRHEKLIAQGWTEESLHARDKEMSQARKDYSAKRINRDEYQERCNFITAKYDQNLVELSEVQEEFFIRSSQEIQKERRELEKKNVDGLKLQTLKRLEKEVKEYIQWVKSQQGY